MEAINESKENVELKSGARAFSVELTFIAIIVLLMLVVLNYFNISSLSTTSPQIFGWLPRIKNENKAITTTIPSTNTTPTGDTERDFHEKRTSDYMGTQVEKQYIPPAAPVFTKSKVDYAVSSREHYHADMLIQGIKVNVGDFDTMIAIIFLLEKTQVPPLTPDGAYPVIKQYFILPSNITASSFKEKSALTRGETIVETTWMNPDGTKESRALRNVSPVNPEGQGNYIVVACKLFKENVGYEQGTCFEK